MAQCSDGSRARRSGPFFQFSDGWPLTRERLVKELRRGLEVAGVRADNYCMQATASELEQLQQQQHRVSQIH